MATNIHQRLSRIENFFSMLLAKKKLSDNIIVGDLPPTTDKDWNDFVNIDVGQQSNSEAFSSGIANIYLYARPKGNPLKKDVKSLDRMESVLDDIICNSDSEHYVIQELYRDSGYDTNRQFHFDMIAVSVMVR